MDARLILLLGLYLLIGVFFITVFITATHTYFDTSCILMMIIWPMVVVVLLGFGVFTLVYKAGVWVGEYIRDKIEDA